MVQYTFQYFSDVHLEFYNENLNKITRLFDINQNKADFLLLAGDIGHPSKRSYAHFLQQMSPYFQKVIVIPGNHEYYNAKKSIEQVDTLCRQVCSSLPQQNVMFLQNEECRLSSHMTVYGTTMWAHIPDSKANIVSSMMNDYRCIGNFSTNTSNELHQKAVLKLNEFIDKQDDEQRVIVLTHHIPSFDLIDGCFKTPFYNDLNCAFATDMPIRHDPKIAAWVYGHTHKPKVEGKFYCNPIGYPGENKQWSLNTFFKVSIDQ